MQPRRPDEDLPSMPLMGHLFELRDRLIKALIGVGVAYAISLTFTDPLWNFVCRPAAQALESVGYPPIHYLIDPMDGFNIIWIKLPIVLAMFLSAPWVLYHLWAFVAPGLYRSERRWAVPFVVCSAGLFIAGGAFAYFVLFRYGLTFLLGISHSVGAGAMVSMDHYFGLFVNVVLGVGIMFELPMLIFLLTAIGLVTPRFLVRNSRYVILAIFVLAAVITPTSDVVNLTMLAGPMCALFALGVFASYHDCDSHLFSAVCLVARQQDGFEWLDKPWLDACGQCLGRSLPSAGRLAGDERAAPAACGRSSGTHRRCDAGRSGARPRCRTCGPATERRD